MTAYRAYCYALFCGWKADTAWEDEDDAYEDLNQHNQLEHAGDSGVRKER
jgi:hypothetical protein